MDLQPFFPETRPLFDRYLSRTARPLSAYSFIPHTLWRDHFSFYWTLHHDHFLLFAEYDRHLYMPLPPLGPPDPEIIGLCFDWMDRKNPGTGVSRIDNIAEPDLPFYRECGLAVEPKSPEYLYRREALADLKGDRYKTHRWACNHFEKNDRASERPYTPADQEVCFALFQRWAKGRAERYSDPVYQWMLRDSESAHRHALTEAEGLGLIGRVVELSGKIVGYTLGFPLDEDTFCIFAEVVDLELTGAAAYLFRAFCKTLIGFEWINTLDDSGLENLRKTKTGYHPARMAGCYFAKRI